jgi:LuxR family maltose regulon positive regulatory protein
VELLQQENLFTIRLDAKGEWFRYHHLFQDLLKRELRSSTSAEEIAALHSQASGWFEAQGLITEAIHHALEGVDQVKAAEIVERHWAAELNEDRWHVVERWLNQLPKAIREKRPSLLLAEAWGAYERFQMEKIPAILDRVESLLEYVPGGEALAAEAAFFRGVMAYWAGEGELAQKYLREARAQLPKDRELVLGMLEFYVGLAKTMTGEREAAVQELGRRIRDHESEGVAYLARLIGALMFIHVISADLAEGRRRVEHFNSVAADSGLAYTKTWGSYIGGSIAFHALELDRAAKHFAEADQDRYIMHAGAAVNGMAGLALSHQLLGDDEAANEAVGRLEAFARELKATVHLAVARSCRARVALLQGDLAGAWEWARPTMDLPPAAGLFIWCEVPAITRARVLIAKGSKESLLEAAEVLGTIRATSEAHHFKQQAIEASVLLALALEGMGQSEEAQGILVETLNQARPGGFVRPFVEAGGALVGMLERLDAPEREGEFVQRILSGSRVEGGGPPTLELAGGSISPAGVARSSGDGAPSPVGGPTSVGSPFGAASRQSSPAEKIPGGSSRRLRPPVDSLTNREFEVLDLLAQRFRDKEIASRLFISTQTVNYHLKNTYRKLGVGSRRQAVARAVELGILSPGRD